MLYTGGMRFESTQESVEIMASDDRPQTSNPPANPKNSRGLSPALHRAAEVVGLKDCHKTNAPRNAENTNFQADKQSTQLTDPLEGHG